MFFTAQLIQHRIVERIPLTARNAIFALPQKHPVIPSQQMFRGACFGDINAFPGGVWMSKGLEDANIWANSELRGFGEDSLTKHHLG